MGAWISYGLGRLNQNLPEFVVMPDPRGLPYNNLGNFSSGFLPSQHGATVIDSDAQDPIAFLHPPIHATDITTESESEGRSLLRQLGAMNAEDPVTQSRIQSYEEAARLQLAAPEVFNLDQESDWVKKRYGMEKEVTRDFAKRCLIARRMLERDVVALKRQCARRDAAAGSRGAERSGACLASRGAAVVRGGARWGAQCGRSRRR